MCAKKEESEDSTEKKMTMPYDQQVDAFTNDLENLITRYSSEFTLTRESMIGCLFTSMQVLGSPMIMDLGSEMLEEEDGEEETEQF